MLQKFEAFPSSTAQALLAANEDDGNETPDSSANSGPGYLPALGGPAFLLKEMSHCLQIQLLLRRGRCCLTGAPAEF